MYKILLKYNIITVIPFNETFFHAVTLPQKIKLTKQLLFLNYAKYSPFKNPNIINLASDKHLMLWFYKEKIDTSIVIPESYLAYKALKKEALDAMYVIKDDTYKIIIIKNSKLINAFTLDNIDELTLKLTMDEYKISTKKELSLQRYQDLLQQTKESLSFQDLYYFNTLDLDKKVLFNAFIDKASYPLAALVILAMLVSFIQESFLESKIQTLEATYLSEKNKNKDIKKFIHRHNASVKKWKNFVQKELVYFGPSLLLQELYSIFREDEKGYLLDVSLNGDKLLVKIQTDVNPILFLNRLNEIKYFKRVVIQNTYKPRNAMKIISYDIEVKKIKEL